MSFAFVFTNDCHMGITQMMPILAQASIPCDLVLSKFGFMELAYLLHVAEHGEPGDREKARLKLLQDQSDIIGRIRQLSPKVVGLSVTTDLYRYSCRLADGIKKACDCKIIMGGPHPTFVPERVIRQDAVDAVCVGEAESSIVDIYRVLSGVEPDATKARGAWIKSGTGLVKNPLAPIVMDLDTLPHPDIEPFAAVTPAMAQGYNINTSRGCPFRCSYCLCEAFNRMYNLQGKVVRRRSPQSVLAELAGVNARYGLKEVRFIDDVFTTSEKWLQEFLPRYQKEIGVPYYCLVHPDTVKEPIIRILKETGCASIKMGVQSVNRRIVKEIFNRNFDMAKIRKVIDLIKDHGLGLKLDFIIGVPTETEQDLLGLVEFLKEVRCDDIFLYFLKYYPGTTILEWARSQGHLTEAEYQGVLDGNDVPYQMIPDHIKAPQREMYGKYNQMIRDAAGSKFRIDNFAYVLNDN